MIFISFLEFFLCISSIVSLDLNLFHKDSFPTVSYPSIGSVMIFFFFLNIKCVFVIFRTLLTSSALDTSVFDNVFFIVGFFLLMRGMIMAGLRKLLNISYELFRRVNDMSWRSLCCNFLWVCYTWQNLFCHVAGKRLLLMR